MGKLAFVFPGQGAQTPGMGLSLFEGSMAAKAVFEQADRVRPGTSRQCFTGTMEELTRTENTQPCMYTVELAAAAALCEAGIRPHAAAGFSLGEITALAFTGIVGFDAGMDLVTRRGLLMQEASDASDGAMCAVLKLTDQQVEEVCNKYDHVWPVNYNCPGQVSCAGLREEMTPFMADVKAAGGRAVPLQVSGAFHSPLMASASEGLREYLRDAMLAAPGIDMYSDCTGRRYEGDYKDLLCRQVCNPVRWAELVKNLWDDGVDTFIECGPGKTLCGLIKKTLPEAKTFAVADTDGAAAVCQALGAEPNM